jgi:glycosyltransferase involved in cell wall biosynthesis
MKKVLLASNLYNPNVGGVENSLHSLSRIYRSRGYEVYIVTSNIDLVDGACLPEFETSEHSIIHRYNVHGVGYLEQYKACKSILKCLLENHDFSLILARGYVPALVLSNHRVNYIYLVPSIVLFEIRLRKLFTAPVGCAKQIFLGALQAYAIRRSVPAVFGFNAYAQVKRLMAGITKRIYVFKPGIDKERFRPVRSDEEKRNLRNSIGLNPNGSYILALGRISEIKQFDKVIRSLIYLPQSVSLLVVGDGPSKSLLIRLAQECEVSDRVFFYSRTTEPELFYRLADVFAMTSRYEAFGQVLLEATASGLPVVSFRGGRGISHNVERIYADFPSLCEFTDVDIPEFAQGVCKFLALDKTSFEEERKRFCAAYSWEKLSSDLLEVHNQQ